MKTFEEILQNKKESFSLLMEKKFLQELKEFIPKYIKESLILIHFSKKNNKELLLVFDSIQKCEEFNKNYAHIMINHIKDKLIMKKLGLDLEHIESLKGYVSKSTLTKQNNELYEEKYINVNIYKDKSKGEFKNTIENKKMYEQIEIIRNIIKTKNKIYEELSRE